MKLNNDTSYFKKITDIGYYDILAEWTSKSKKVTVSIEMHVYLSQDDTVGECFKVSIPKWHGVNNVLRGSHVKDLLVALYPNASMYSIRVQQRLD